MFDIKRKSLFLTVIAILFLGHVTKASILEKNDLSKIDSPIFQPKQTEPPNDDDYIIDFIYEDYLDPPDYTSFEPLDPGNKKNPDAKSSTNSPKWIIKNSTSPTGPNLKNIFDFAEFFLRPTNPNENTVEISVTSKTKVNESETFPNVDYYVHDEIDQINPLEKRLFY
jgi:hypothetical protein